MQVRYSPVSNLFNSDLLSLDFNHPNYTAIISVTHFLLPARLTIGKGHNVIGNIPRVAMRTEEEALAKGDRLAHILGLGGVSGSIHGANPKKAQHTPENSRQHG